MVKFISYDGKYPTLCMGVLTVEIDGKEYKFGHNNNDYDWKTNSYNDNNFDEFWVSGGCIERDKDYNMWSETDEWKINCDWSKEDKNHPQFIIDVLPELIKIFNENVPFGCCGGCI